LTSTADFVGKADSSELSPNALTAIEQEKNKSKLKGLGGVLKKAGLGAGLTQRNTAITGLSPHKSK
jgi:hypothetical protein